MSVTDYFRWQKKEADHFINQTKRIVGQWKKRADYLNISRSEQSIMESAFNK